MQQEHPGDLTRLLARWGEGDRAAVAELIPLVYEELRGIARAFLRNERPGHTLPTTALVHEAYLRLHKMDSVRWQNRAQFFALAAQILRHILVDHARERNAAKRGGGVKPAMFDEALAIPAPDSVDFEALDRSLEKLARIDPRKVSVVELRFFAGLSVEEVAGALNCSTMTVKRDWNFARAWLYRELAGEG